MTAQTSYDLARAPYWPGAYSLLGAFTVRRTLYADERALISVRLADAISAGT